ncbi:MAG: calcium-binding protein [Cyanobacteria bacterium P01_F01_bin.150]
MGDGGNDFLAGEDDNDKIYGEKGHDILSGGRGDDVLDGGIGRDVLKGDSGNDVLAGGYGGDQLTGGSGSDLLIGGMGQDMVSGGEDDDVLYGDNYFIPSLPIQPNAFTSVAFPIVDPTIGTPDGPLDLTLWLRLEAEDMRLIDYDVISEANASEGKLIVGQDGQQGKAKTTFYGPNGIYDLVVGYFDDADGTSDLSLVISSQNGQKAEYGWALDESTGAGSYQISGISLASGDRLELIGTTSGSDLARLDYLDILTTGTTPTIDEMGNPTFYKFTGAPEDRIDYGEFVAVAAPAPQPESIASANPAGDVLNGGADNDMVYGGNGNDSLYGELGDDTLYGDYGDNPDETGVGSTTIFSSSFEGDSGIVASPFDGWSSNYGYLDVRDSNSAVGSSHIELNAKWGLIQSTHQISRQVETQVGQLYTLSFQYAPRNGFDEAVSEMDVRLDSQSLLTLAEDGTNDSSLNWQTYTVSFEGDGHTQTLEFISTGTTPSFSRGAQLDDIQLVSAPLHPGVIADIHDQLIGGPGNDHLSGGHSNDILNGSDELAAGAAEQDILTGGTGSDRFILGDTDQSYYIAQGDEDYATVMDFNPFLDIIQLHGTTDAYQQEQHGQDLWLSNGDELIAIFKSIGNLSFASPSVEFV